MGSEPPRLAVDETRAAGKLGEDAKQLPYEDPGVKTAVNRKKIELQTLWIQPNVDKARVEKLSNEVADLGAKLFKKRDEFLLQCRREFGDQDWTCPGAGWQGGRWTP